MSARSADVLPVVTLGEAMCRVYRWWHSTREGHRLGYSPRSVIGRVIEEGPTGAGQDRGVRPGTYLPPDVEQIDALVARLPVELREAVIEDQDRSKSLRQVAAKLHCTPAEFHRRRNAGYGYIAGVLTVWECGLTPKGRG